MNKLWKYCRSLGEGWRTVLIALGVLVFLVGVVFLLSMFLPKTNVFKDVSGIIQSIITALAIVMGGYFALFKLRIFRDLEPHLTISHKISHRFIGDSYVHISVTAVLHNRSKVKVELRRGFFSLQKIAPVMDGEVSNLYEQVFDEEGSNEEDEHIQWPTLDIHTLIRGKGELVIEPGESHPEPCEFIVSKDVESVLAYTYFDNPRYSQGSGVAPGWQATTVYDISYMI